MITVFFQMNIKTSRLDDDAKLNCLEEHWIFLDFPFSILNSGQMTIKNGFDNVETQKYHR